MTKKEPVKKKFPKTRPMGRALGNIIDIATDVAAEVAKKEGIPDNVADATNKAIDRILTHKGEEPKAPEAEVLTGEKRFIRIDLKEGNAVHITIEGLNPFESLVVLKNAHKYMYNNLKKEMDALDVGKEGTTDSVSGSDT
jgi:hypothetical protein